MCITSNQDTAKNISVQLAEIDSDVELELRVAGVRSWRRADVKLEFAVEDDVLR